MWGLSSLSLNNNTFGGFPKLGVPFLGGSYNKDYSIVVYIGVPYLWKLPFLSSFSCLCLQRALWLSHSWIHVVQHEQGPIGIGRRMASDPFWLSEVWE